MEKTVHVLRLGHRPKRDERLTTHCALTARAFSAVKLFYTGTRDAGFEKSIEDVVKKWGGSFTVTYARSWQKLVQKHKRDGFVVVHLTMYGMPIMKKMSKLKKQDKLLIVVGGAKVPYEIYSIADFNISVGLQPHSEVAALAILLHELFEGKELEKRFENAKLEILPQENGKKVRQLR